MTTQVEIKEALEKFNSINNIYSNIEITNREAIVWWRKLNDLCIHLCDTKHWDALVEKMEYVKSFRTA